MSTATVVSSLTPFTMQPAFTKRHRNMLRDLRQELVTHPSPTRPITTLPFPICLLEPANSPEQIIEDLSLATRTR